MAAEIPALVDHMELATRNRVGQPTKRTPKLIDEMCLLIMRGSSLLMVCQRPDMPGYSTVMKWCQGDKDLLEQFDRAREMTAYAIDEFNEVIARGILPYATGDFRRDELIININNQRKRHLNRKRFGEKLDVTATQTVQVAMPDWMLGQVQGQAALPSGPDPDVMEGQIIPVPDIPTSD